MDLISRSIFCPYCGEQITIAIDESEVDADYFEDCSVCCRPIRFITHEDADGKVDVDVLRDDET